MKAAIKDKMCETIITLKNVKSVKHRGNNIHVLLHTGMEVILPVERYIVKEVKDENDNQSSNH